jgi:CRP/FNR family transcriptional regulator, cyclic AMP receptor protein
MANPGSFLSQLDPADRAALEQRWLSHRYNRKETVITQDDEGCDVFLLLEGRARVTIYSAEGRVVAYRDIAPGDIFGELSAIDGEVRSASVVALEPTQVARLSAAAFREIVSTRASFAWALLRHLSMQMRRLTERVYEFSTLVVRQRLVRELLRRADTREQPDAELKIDPAPTHFDLAASISTHREAISREMSSLAKRGLIKRRGKALLLLDVGGLRALGAGEDAK